MIIFFQTNFLGILLLFKLNLSYNVDKIMQNYDLKLFNIYIFHFFQQVTAENVDRDEFIRKFFFELVDTTMDLDNPNCHLDFLASSLVTSNTGHQVIQSLQDFLRVCSFT